MGSDQHKEKSPKTEENFHQITSRGQPYSGYYTAREPRREAWERARVKLILKECGEEIENIWGSGASVDREQHIPGTGEWRDTENEEEDESART